MFSKVKLLVLWVTNDCNLNCKYCYANGGEKKEYMNFDTAKKAIDMIKSDSFKIQFAGGEPMMNFSLIRDIYNYVQSKDKKITLQMQSNGTLIDDEISKEIKKMDIKMGISFDGGLEINEKFRGKSIEAINGIKALGKNGVIVNLNTVITKDSIRSLSKLIELAYYLGNVNGIGLDLLRITGRAKKNNLEVASYKDIEKYLNEAYKKTEYLSSLTNRKVIIREIEDAKGRIKHSSSYCNTNYCHATYGGSMVVYPSGDVYPCGSLSGSKKYYMGNVHDLKSLRMITINTAEKENCNSCRFKNICTKGCPARSIINSNGQVSKEDCYLRKVSFEICDNFTFVGENSFLPNIT